MLRVIIVGGSIGGLTAALLLRDVGYEVRVFERSSITLKGRGAGLVVLDATLRYLKERGGYCPDDICCTTNWIRVLNRTGNIQHVQRHNYRFSSWNIIYQALLGLFGGERYFLSHEVVNFELGRKAARVILADGSCDSANLLVCADGIGSRARSWLLPEVAPCYAGYVAWRGTISEFELSESGRTALRDAITYQVLEGGHVLVYPIPGLDSSCSQVERLINLVWYVNVNAGQQLTKLMTGRDGVQRYVSVPQGLVNDDAVADMRSSAAKTLAPPIAEVAAKVRTPFIQAIYDIGVPKMAYGRMCLVGDAAFVVRPHPAAATAKAAADGWELAKQLCIAEGNVSTALTAWEEQQLKLGRQVLARSRDIGNRAQFTGTFNPVDPMLIFGLYGPGK